MAAEMWLMMTQLPPQSLFFVAVFVAVVCVEVTHGTLEPRVIEAREIAEETEEVGCVAHFVHRVLILRVVHLVQRRGNLDELVDGLEIDQVLVVFGEERVVGNIARVLGAVGHHLDSLKKRVEAVESLGTILC